MFAHRHDNHAHENEARGSSMASAGKGFRIRVIGVARCHSNSSSANGLTAVRPARRIPIETSFTQWGVEQQE
jgi:hypothetical protein